MACLQSGNSNPGLSVCMLFLLSALALFLSLEQQPEDKSLPSESEVEITGRHLIHNVSINWHQEIH